MFKKIKKEFYLNFGNNIITTEEQYDNIIIPKRSTIDSAGYDFFSPIEITVDPGEIIKFPTGIKWNGYKEQKNLNYTTPWIKYNVALFLYPRSSLGFKYGFDFLNTVPIIDLDYYNNPNNDGHIILGFTVKKKFHINIGDKICQGIITPTIIHTNEITPKEIRHGGIGSTGN